MGEVINILDVMQSRNLSKQGPAPAANTQITNSTVKEHSSPEIKLTIDVQVHTSDSSDKQSKKLIDASRLYGETVEVGKKNAAAALIEACSLTIGYVDDCLEAHNNDDLVQSDLSFMDVKTGLRDLQEFLYLSDGVGLVVTQYQIYLASKPALLKFIPIAMDVRRSLNALRMKPNMSFNYAMELVSVLESAHGEDHVPGYKEIFDLLVGNGSEELDKIGTLPVPPVQG